MAQVSDYNIANASGASVRSDLNAVFSAIKTLNSGGSDPSNTEAFMPYVDTADNNNLKIRNSGNTGFTTIGPVNTANLGLLPRAGGTMTGNILGHDGTGAASPSYSFDTDTDTGMYRAASNTIGFSTAGVERVLISNNGFELKDGLAIRFQDSSGSPFVSLKSPSSLSGNVDLTLPATDGSSGQVLQTDGSGNLSFVSLSAGFSGSAGDLSGNTLASGVTSSSLTSLGTLGSLTVSGNISANGNINGDGSTNISSINTFTTTNANTTTTKASQYRSNNTSSPVFQNLNGSETHAGRLVRMSVNFDSFRGGSATDNFTSIRRSFNVSSITDHGEGQFSVNFSTSLPSGSTTAGMIDLERFTNNNHCTLYLENTSGAGTGSVRVRICSAQNSGHVFDKNSVNVVCFA